MFLFLSIIGVNLFVNVSPVFATGVSQCISGTQTGVVSSSTTYYSSLDGNYMASTAEVQDYSLASPAGTINNLYIYCDTAPSGSTDWTYTIYKDGSSTSLTVNLTGTATTGSDLSDSVSVVGGDYLTLKIAPTSSPTLPGTIRWKMDFTPTNADNYWVIGNYGTADVFNGTIYYDSIGGSSYNSTTSTDLTGMVIPIAGTLENLYVRVDVAPSSNFDNFVVEYNSGSGYADTSLLTSLTGTSVSGSNVVNTVSVSAGGILGIKSSSNGTVSVYMDIGTTFIPSVSGSYFVGNGAPIYAQSYSGVYGILNCQGNVIPNSTYSQQYIYTSAYKVTDLYVTVPAAPGTGGSFIVTIMRNGVATAVTATISNSNTSASDTSDIINFNAGDTITYQVSTSGLPSNTNSRIQVSIAALQPLTPPSVSSASPPTVTSNSVTMAGSLDSWGGYTSGYEYFVYGLSGDFSLSTTKNPIVYPTSGVFDTTITGLAPSTAYNYKAVFLYNGSQSYAYGLAENFTTSSSTAPTVSTLAASSITNNSAIISGNITSLGAYTTVNVYFEWGTDTNYTNGNTPPQPYSTQTSFSYSLDSTNSITLQNGVTYHYQAILTYVDGSGNTQTVYGGDMYFTAGIQGSTVIQIFNVGVFNNYLTNSPTAPDTLITMEVVDNYTGYTKKTASKYFQVQLLAADDSTILAASNLQNWGDRPESIYLNSTVTTASITYGSPYYIRVIGYNVPTNPYEDYLIQPADWQGSDLTQLDSSIILMGMNMALTDNQTYTTVLADGHSQITDNAVGYFVNGIPDITNIRPNDFTSSTLNSAFPNTTANNQWDSNTAWTTNVGTNISSDATIMGAPFGITGKDFLAAFIWIFVLCVIGYTVSQGGKPLPALLLCMPIIWLGTYWKILPVQQLIVICIIFFFFGVRQFFIKTT